MVDFGIASPIVKSSNGVHNLVERPLSFVKIIENQSQPLSVLRKLLSYLTFS